MANPFSSNLLRQLDPNVRLILIQLAGGNDGLNTVVPVRSDEYYRLRPTIAIPKGQVLSLSSDLGLHPKLKHVHSMFEEGDLTIVNNVGYPEPSLSHFRSTEVWTSASQDNFETGWIGRQYSGVAELENGDPLAMQIGSSGNLLSGFTTDVGASFSSANNLVRTATSGRLYDLSNLPDTPYGEKMAYVREVANLNNRYTPRVKEAYEAGAGDGPEIARGDLEDSAEAILRLIRGGLETRVYNIVLGGFDTHTDELLRHGWLMRSLSDGMGHLRDGLMEMGAWEDTLIMTFSEFGRRPYENGSMGTDHGTLAPLFLGGGSVSGAILGGLPDLSNVDEDGQMKGPVDFRAVYQAVLSGFMGLDRDKTKEVLGGSYEELAVFADRVAKGEELGPEPFYLKSYPNPVTGPATFQFGLSGNAPVDLTLYDALGRQTRNLESGHYTVGDHVLTVDLSGLPAGTYFARLRAGTKTATRQLTIVN